MVEANPLLIGAVALVLLVAIFSFVAMGSHPAQQPSPPPTQQGQAPAPGEDVRIPSGLRCSGGSSPFALSYFRLEQSGLLVIVPCSNAADDITLRKMTAAPTTSSKKMEGTFSFSRLKPGEVGGAVTFNTEPCTAGSLREFNLEFTYDTTSLNNIKQTGARPLTLKCG